jgi:sigma-B regulation protein RsbU (phosphoserine phosphatase)
MSEILVVDDEQAIRHLLSEVLAKDGHRVENASDGDAAIEALHAGDFDLVVSDLHMKDVDGISVLRATKSKNPYTEVLILTGKGTVATAVEAMRLGAYEYLTKPVDLQEFRLKVRQALERRAMRMQIEAQRRELQIHQDMIARDLKLAAQVQRSLVPPAFQHERAEVAVRYKPMIGVGGDFSDIYFDGERQLYLTIVDVTGHGITAALLVNRMANEIRRLLRERLEPRVLLHQFNNFICDSFAGTGMFLTMFICKLDLKSLVLTYAGSAHPAAIIWREQQAQFEKLESQNPIVGFDQAELERFTQNLTDLRPKDKLLMYTDGIIEAENAAGKALGLRGMLGFINTGESFSAEEAADKILGGLSQWTNRPLRDDVYLLVAGMK